MLPALPAERFRPVIVSFQTVTDSMRDPRVFLRSDWLCLMPGILLLTVVAAQLLSSEALAESRRGGVWPVRQPEGDPFLAPESPSTSADISDAESVPDSVSDGEEIPPESALDDQITDSFGAESTYPDVDSDLVGTSYLPEQALDQPGVPPRDEEWTEPGEVFDPAPTPAEEDTANAPGGPPGGPPGGKRRFISDNVDGFTFLIPRDGFSVMEYDARTALVIPLFLGGPPPKLAFGVGATTFETPDGFETPNTLYNVQLELRWLRPINDWMALDLAAGPSWFTDFNTSAGRGLRITGRALLFMTNSETVKTAVGFVYLGRDGLVAVPAVGLICSPTEDVRYELMIPRPRAVWRLAKSETSEHWAYLGGELFGGNNWAIDRADGSEDTFVYRDYRLLAGYEFKETGGISIRAEAGFVFAREARYENAGTELNPGNTGFVRAVLSY